MRLTTSKLPGKVGMMADGVVSRGRHRLGRFGEVELARGPALVDRGSSFTATVCWPLKSAAAAEAAVALMRMDGANATADHNMSAYRVTSGRKIEKKYDDDGEARGGQRLLGCLTKVKALGCAVIVSRVWGGQNLGQARFAHIATCATRLLEALGHRPGVGIDHGWGVGMRLGAGSSGSCQGAEWSHDGMSPQTAGGSRAATDSGRRSGKKRKCVSAMLDAPTRREMMAAAAEKRFAAAASTESARGDVDDEAKLEEPDEDPESINFLLVD